MVTLASIGPVLPPVPELEPAWPPAPVLPPVPVPVVCPEPAAPVVSLLLPPVALVSPPLPGAALPPLCVDWSPLDVSFDEEHAARNIKIGKARWRIGLLPLSGNRSSSAARHELSDSTLLVELSFLGRHRRPADSWRLAFVGATLARVSRASPTPKVTLPVRPDGRFRLAAVADTHSRPHPATRERLLELEPDAILHAGDIGDLAVLKELAEVAPVFAVRGNIDVQAADVPEKMLIELVDGDALKLRILLVHIAVYGPKLRADVARVATHEGAALVVCGHSHVPFIGRDRGIAVFNPGSIGPRRFNLPIVLGAVDVTQSTASIRHIDCETGKSWTPSFPARPASGRDP
jgi:putative phosphoesterase